MRTHLLGIEDLTADALTGYLDNAQSFIEVSERDIKKVPTLRGKTIINLFLEPSTRTRVSFEIAAKRLSAEAINVSDGGSSTSKGETLLDTVKNLEAMSPDVIVIRHGSSGAPHFIARHLKRASVVNAGDGMHEHPTQALLDCLTLREHFGKLSKLRIAIVGDVLHSRVARSNIWAHLLLGNEVRLVGPPSLLPAEFSSFGSTHGSQVRSGTVTVTDNLEQGISGCDVVMVLRLQQERMKQKFLPSLDEYSDHYCVTEGRLSKWASNCMVLHPGPANRGVEISTEVMDGPRSLVHRQVTLGVAVRMAVLFQHAIGVPMTVAHHDRAPEEASTL